MHEAPDRHAWIGVLTCDTCEGEIDVPDEHADLGLCRACGVAFLLDVREARQAG
ncbi:hypothetical protein ACHAAC_08730 [Aeromicrobium sp. CF4.19]|uniref:hypothetical protein n=1 Tax=Aeromicrobium sp. CF4.19 TaxID=3373082 RepID=UPI003EE50786